MATYVFPGQGSQGVGMGGSLFSEFPDIIQNANAILGYSIEDICLRNPHGQLNHTEYTQPAIYVVSALHYMKKVKVDNQKPNYVAGHSLGEYNALLAANVFDFETGLKLVQKRGKLMSQAAGGGMAAVVGLKSTEVQKILEQQGLTNISIANFNSHTQVVISGPEQEIATTQPLFEKAGAILFMPLKVSGAFHSPYMRAARQEFVDFLQNFSFQAPTIPVISNLTAKPYDPYSIQFNLSQQITSPVQWTNTIEYLLENGESDFYEIGSGTILSGLISRIRKKE